MIDLIVFLLFDLAGNLNVLLVGRFLGGRGSFLWLGGVDSARCSLVDPTSGAAVNLLPADLAPAGFGDARVFVAELGGDLVPLTLMMLERCVVLQFILLVNYVKCTGVVAQHGHEELAFSSREVAAFLV